MRSVFINIALVVWFLFAAVSCKSTQTSNVDNSTVNHLDIERYMGTWFEIARFDHPFERNLVGVTATYKLRPDGKITVINKGYKNSFEEKLKKAKGKAKIPDPEEPGKLKVSFFLFFYADYYVMELDKDYQWALIGSSTDDYLWILSRTPQLEPDILNNILQMAENRGYDLNKFIMVEQQE